MPYFYAERASSESSVDSDSKTRKTEEIANDESISLTDLFQSYCRHASSATSCLGIESQLNELMSISDPASTEHIERDASSSTDNTSDPLTHSEPSSGTRNEDASITLAASERMLASNSCTATETNSTGSSEASSTSGSSASRTINIGRFFVSENGVVGIQEHFNQIRSSAEMNSRPDSSSGSSSSSQESTIPETENSSPGSSSTSGNSVESNTSSTGSNEASSTSGSSASRTINIGRFFVSENGVVGIQEHFNQIRSSAEMNSRPDSSSGSSSSSQESTIPETENSSPGSSSTSGNSVESNTIENVSSLGFKIFIGTVVLVGSQNQFGVLRYARVQGEIVDVKMLTGPKKGRFVRTDGTDITPLKPRSDTSAFPEQKVKITAGPHLGKVGVLMVVIESGGNETGVVKCEDGSVLVEPLSSMAVFRGVFQSVCRC